MQKIKYEFVFYYITVATMTALSFASLLLLREVLIFKYCADASLSVYGKIQGGIEDILSAVVVYLIFSFISALFTQRDMYD